MTTLYPAYLATLHMRGVGDCSTPYDEVPRGQVLRHDLSLIKDGSEETKEEAQSVV